MEDVLWRLWGKTGASPEQYHPALCHMLDVASIARCLLWPPATVRWRMMLGRALGAEPETLLDWVPWLVGLHDIGKVSAAFQMEVDTQAQRLMREGFSFGDWRPSLEVHHTSIGQVFAMRSSDPCLTAMPKRLRIAWAHMIAGHHGRYAIPGQLGETRRLIESFEPSEWETWRAMAFQQFGEVQGLPPSAAFSDPPNLSAAIMALTGFTILCDWLGSDTTFFPAEPTSDLPAYAAASMGKAEQAVAHAGLSIESFSREEGSFVALFPDKLPPRPLQESIDAVPADLLAKPCLTIIEAPTGEGKTEAALTLAHRIALGSGTDELYYALPTTATSNQMFARLQQYLSGRLKLDTHVKLVHGQAFLVEDDLRLAISAEETAKGAVAALEWFGPRKRAMLAPFGVGTIDQCELAALNVRHGALRLVGLAGKVLILDEVHAYDTYMTTIIERLLAWLAELGTSVVLLSATLPLTRRRALVHAYLGDSPAIADVPTGYPSLWIVGLNGTYNVTPPAAQPERQLALNWLYGDDDDYDDKARWLLDQVGQGGCACWIANTVARAQRLYRAVRTAAPHDVDCMLLHARFPLERRAALEASVTARYGPPTAAVTRPTKGIVIGTQVLEQSLDLDFDVMATDLAPVDLLLQRAGRLHRHARMRPARHNSPRLTVHLSLNDADEPSLSADRHVYSEYILLRTWQVLRDRAMILLPADYRALVDAVYGEVVPPENERIARSLTELNVREKGAMHEAEQRMLPPPYHEQAFCTVVSGEFEENETLAAWAIAQTRLGEETVTVIPMEREGSRAKLVLLEERFALDKKASRDAQLRLLRYGLRVGNPEVVSLLRAQAEPLPRLFSCSSLLRDTLPLWMEAGHATLVNGRHTVVLELDAECGLLIERQQ
ncbi:MAG: CRISPR-associated helicase Cas3' [Anaerolineae bacterium]